MIEMLLAISDDGAVRVYRLADGEIEAKDVEINPAFDTCLLDPDGEDLVLHTDLTVDPDRPGPKRAITITVRDDEIPKFASPADADAWMESRLRQ